MLLSHPGSTFSCGQFEFEYWITGLSRSTMYYTSNAERATGGGAGGQRRHQTLVTGISYYNAKKSQPTKRKDDITHHLLELHTLIAVLVLEHYPLVRVISVVGRNK